MKEKKIKISVNEEDVQNLINCYEKDIEYIKKLEKENKELKEKINKAIEYIKHSNWLRQDQIYDNSYMQGWEVKELLEILKG